MRKCSTLEYFANFVGFYYLTLKKNLKSMNLLKNLKNNVPLKITFILLTCLLLVKQLLILSNIFIDYLWILDFLSWRLFFIFCILILLQSLLNLPFIKDLQQEMLIFNEGPVNKSFFITQLRKYHFSLLLSAYLLYSLAVTYFVNDPSISYLLGVIAFISLILYLVQFAVYTKEYVTKSFRFNKNIFNKGKKKGSTRGMVTASTVKKVATVCMECAKGAITFGGGLEIAYKLTHGGMNDVSPWRQEWLNKTFVDDKTKIWTESKAAMAMHNRAMGNPHNSIYDSVGNKIIKSFPNKDKRFY